ncbi:MAG TPA: 6-pyruvoyl-tetrahydropterin synthase-related protein [Terracidiphilus sp.]|nr:6-pyruvoyl-tetrahydropterin synthase-related protein [Terracidiphilus sp.]
MAAALAVAPQMVRGDSCGHDFDFHLVSWIDVLASWRHGIIYPHWAISSNYNAGEPRFVFYPPLTWMMGAALGALLPWSWVPAALTFLLLAGSGWATRALARTVIDDAAATLAGCIAIFSGYTLYTVYERAAFAELAGGVWIPLLLLLVLRDRGSAPAWRRTIGGSAVGLSLVVAGAWLSNAPVGVMACYLLAGFAAVVAAMRRSWVPVLRAAVGAVIGLGLAAFYLVPAAVEQRWVDIRQATEDPGELIQNSFLFVHPADPQLALHDAELGRVSWIAVLMLVVILVAIVVGWHRRILPGGRSVWVPLALIPAVVLLLMLPISLPVWDALPKMRFLQFPWRWLVVLEAPLGIFAASAIWVPGRARRNAIVAGCAVVFCGLSLFAGRVFFQVCDPYDAVPGMLQEYRDGNGFQGTDEYEPAGADNSLVAQNLPAGCLVADPARTLGVTTADDPQPEWEVDQKSCEAAMPDPAMIDARRWSVRGELPRDGFLVLRLRRYPAWDVRVNGRSVRDLGDREDGLMVVPVSAGQVEVDANWLATPDARRGRWISIAALALVVGLGLTGRRRTGIQLK